MGQVWTTALRIIREIVAVLADLKMNRQVRRAIQPRNDSRQITDRDFFVIAYVERFSRRAGEHNEQHASDGLPHITETARRPPVAVQYNRPSVECRRHQIWNNPAVIQALARSIHIEWPYDLHGRTIKPMIGGGQRLSQAFRFVVAGTRAGARNETAVVFGSRDVERIGIP